MSDKKRKSSSKESERPSKKQQTSNVSVHHVAGPDTAKPVIAISPGTAFPDVIFQSFAKTQNGRKSLLLRSSDHSTLEYTAREGDNSIENQLKHYVAVFDPETGDLQVTEAKNVTVRSALRSAMTTGANEDDARTMDYQSRKRLTELFGTKKSKKAVQNIDENRKLAQGTSGLDNPISDAILAQVDADEDSSNVVSLADTLYNKPIPPVDLGATEIDQVYSLEKLIWPRPGASTLEMMPINTWKARLAQKKDVKTRLRFVASRVGYLAITASNSPDVTDTVRDKAAQVLRYIQLLTEIHTYVTSLPRRRPIPPTSEWPERTMSEDTPNVLLQPIMKHFFPDRTPKDHSITLLRTTILALTLHIPPPSMQSKPGTLMTEPTDISLDMAIDAVQVRKLYRELGCKVGPATESELKRLGYERLVKKKKDEAGIAMPKPNFAKLDFPLDFPKVSRGRPSVRR